MKKCFNNYNIPLNNIIGLATDGAAVMVGKNNSLYSHLKKDIAHLVLIKCICHTSAIVASKACAQLPRTPEDLIRNIATYVSGSAKRCAVLTEFQDYFNTEKKKILKLSTTRWLSMHKCIERILENWDVLKHYFTYALAEDHLKMAEQILEGLNDSVTKCYLLFMRYVLNYFNSFNALFQSRNILIHELFDRSKTILMQIMQNFVKPELLYLCENIDIRSPHSYVILEKINVGIECSTEVEKLPRNLREEVRLKCLNFYITASEEMQKRLPLNNSIFKEISNITQDVALRINDHSLTDLFKITCQNFSTLINLTKLEYEWQNLPLTFTDAQKTELLKLDILSFWHTIENFKNENNDQKFPEISKFINFLLVFPHSNAESERIFSMVTDIKRKKRNKLGTDSLNAMTFIRSAMNCKGQNCFSTPIKEEHLQLHNENMYSFKSK